MEKVEYSEAAVEVLDILNHMEAEEIAKVPQNFIKFLIDISNENDSVKLNHKQSMNELNLKKQTKELLGFMYITWWCEPEKYEIYKQRIQENKMIQTQQYDTIFASKREKRKQRILQNETSVIEYKKVNKVNQILAKIRSFFYHEKKGN